MPKIILTDNDKDFLRTFHADTMKHANENSIRDGLPATYGAWGKQVPSPLVIFRAIEVAEQSFKIIDRAVKQFIGDISAMPGMPFPTVEDFLKACDGMAYAEAPIEMRRFFLLRSMENHSRVDVTFGMVDAGVLDKGNLLTPGKLNIDPANPGHMGVAHALNRQAVNLVLVAGPLRGDSAEQMAEHITRLTSPTGPTAPLQPDFALDGDELDYMRNFIGGLTRDISYDTILTELPVTYVLNGLPKPDNAQLADAMEAVVMTYEGLKLLGRHYLDGFDSLKHDAMFVPAVTQAMASLREKPYPQADLNDRKVFHLATFSNLSQLALTKTMLTITRTPPRIEGSREKLAFNLTDDRHVGALHVVTKIKQATLVEKAQLWNVSGEELNDILDRVSRPDGVPGRKPKGYDA